MITRRVCVSECKQIVKVYNDQYVYPHKLTLYHRLVVSKNHNQSRSNTLTRNYCIIGKPGWSLVFGYTTLNTI